MDQKLKHARIYFEIVSKCLSCQYNLKKYSLMDLRCLVFIRYYRSKVISNLYRGQNLKLFLF